MGVAKRFLMAEESSQIVETLPHVDDLPHTRLSLVISRGLQRLADIVSWIWLVLVAVIVINVIMRYVFGEGRVEFEQLGWVIVELQKPSIEEYDPKITVNDTDSLVHVVQALHNQVGQRRISVAAPRSHCRLLGALLLQS